MSLSPLLTEIVQDVYDTLVEMDEVSNFSWLDGSTITFYIQGCQVCYNKRDGLKKILGNGEIEWPPKPEGDQTVKVKQQITKELINECRRRWKGSSYTMTANPIVLTVSDVYSLQYTCGCGEHHFRIDWTPVKKFDREWLPSARSFLPNSLNMIPVLECHLPRYVETQIRKISNLQVFKQVFKDGVLFSVTDSRRYENRYTNGPMEWILSQNQNGEMVGKGLKWCANQYEVVAEHTLTQEEALRAYNNHYFRDRPQMLGIYWDTVDQRYDKITLIKHEYLSIHYADGSGSGYGNQGFQFFVEQLPINNMLPLIAVVHRQNRLDIIQNIIQNSTILFSDLTTIVANFLP